MSENHFFRFEGGMSVWQAVLDYLAGKWIDLTLVFVAGGGMTYLAAISAWLKPWGPIVWGAIGISFAIIIGAAISVLKFLNSKTQESKAKTVLDDALSQRRSLINPLDRQFNRQVIYPNDLFIPYSPMLEASYEDRAAHSPSKSLEARQIVQA